MGRSVPLFILLIAAGCGSGSEQQQDLTNRANVTGPYSGAAASLALRPTDLGKRYRFVAQDPELREMDSSNFLDTDATSFKRVTGARFRIVCEVDVFNSVANANGFVDFPKSQPREFGWHARPAPHVGKERFAAAVIKPNPGESTEKVMWRDANIVAQCGAWSSKQLDARERRALDRAAIAQARRIEARR